MIPDGYNRSKLKKAIKSPHLLRDELYRLSGIGSNHLRSKLFDIKYDGGTDIMLEDWDNLIILDACRHDIFRNVNTIDGQLRRVASKGSASKEFMMKNFEGRQLYDTVYITGNPHCHTVGIEDVFYDIKYSYDDVSYRESEWDEMTVAEQLSPASVYNTSVNNVQNYENKRKIIHFMQPHAPYHGSKAEAMREKLREEHGLVFGHFNKHKNLGKKDSDITYNSLLHTVRDGYISPEELRKIYTENLKIVLEYVEDLLDELEGRTVITADHGELLGEPIESPVKRLSYPKVAVHGNGLFVPELRFVPWLVIHSEQRPEIFSERPMDKKDMDSDVIEHQLEALGYR